MVMDDTTPVIVIPGYMGSTLRDLDSGRQRWGGLTLLWTDYRTMRVEPDRTRGEASALRLRAERPLWPMYPGLLRRLRRSGRRVLFFPWDWRRSLLDIAGNFHEFVVERFGGRPVDIVGHSLGCLIAALWYEGQGRELLRRYAGIALPVAGAEKAITVLRDGDERFARFNLRTSRETMRRLAWDCPSIYEALPPLQGVYDRSAWPADLGVRADLLSSSRALRGRLEAALASLARRGEREILLIAGAGVRTGHWRLDADGLLEQGPSADGDGWLRAESVRLPGIPTRIFHRTLQDSTTLGLHYPGAILIGSHPMLPMFRRIQEAIADFLDGKPVRTLETV